MRGFSTIELVCALVILAILMGLGLGRFSVGSSEARLNEHRLFIQSIRAKLNEERVKRAIAGASSELDLVAASIDADGQIFGAVMPYGVPSGWSAGASAGVYKLSFTHQNKAYEALFYYCSCETFAADKTGRAAETCNYTKKCVPKTSSSAKPALGGFLCAYKTAKTDTPEACAALADGRF